MIVLLSFLHVTTCLPVPAHHERIGEVSVEILSVGGFNGVDPLSSLLSTTPTPTAATGETLCGVTRAQSLHCWGDGLVVTMRPTDGFFLQVCTAYEYVKSLSDNDTLFNHLLHRLIHC
jgi:hypothetical protein